MRLVTVLLAAALLAACGEDSPSEPVAVSTVDAAFSAKVETTCQELDKGNPTFPLAAGTFDRHDPTAAELRAIAGYMVKADANFSTAPGALTALGLPSTGAIQWEAFLTALRTEADSIADRVAAAKAADVEAWKRAMADADVNNAALGSAYSTAGIAAPTCQTYFGV